MNPTPKESLEIVRKGLSHITPSAQSMSALATLTALVERDEAKKVTVRYANGRLSNCPSCLHAMQTQVFRFCSNCGQRLDWSDK